MNEERYIDILKERLRDQLPPDWVIKEDEEDKYTLNISFSDKESNGFSLRFRDVFDRIRSNENEADRYIGELLERVDVLIHTERANYRLSGHEDKIYPVLRHPSLKDKSEGNKKLVNRPHTPESDVFYAYDLGKTYLLINQDMLEKDGWTEDFLHETAMNNLRKLDYTPKVDQLGDNTFYFISHTDGYAASRVLLPELMQWMEKKIEGEMAVAIPHQDALIFADLRDKRGHAALAQMTIDFSVRGDVPISSLPFIYEEGELVPFLAINMAPKSRIKPILGHKKKKQE